ncbi:universal stress protein [Lentzea sp. BCCO 10_0061]|uniref:Universal stress protein n=1 Tax=Lentzea sokolovensis TaxID=3095429 RepID=A0ABU4URR1_9PSEU|nr:universal stress protein [Lentzea sp. BCCO 10_0061]MDX8141395.1 universal stress protein [Lentzea sp. BCCO 10_0061]
MNSESRIVVGVDGSPAAKAALAWAVAEAKRTNASVLALSVCHFKPSADNEADPFAEGHRRNLRAAVDALGAAGNGVRIDQDIPLGTPGPVLVERAAGADFLVVGGHGDHRSGVLVMSSVTSYCLRHARCPVVVVPAEGAHHDGPLMLRPETPVR